ncbi:MAG: hypothetical protein ACOX75_08155 [Lachnospiraceae bacterium]|jgi:hypothetical protein
MKTTNSYISKAIGILLLGSIVFGLLTGCEGQPENNSSTADTEAVVESESTERQTESQSAEESTTPSEPESPADWETTDPELMMKQMTESEDFSLWRYVFTFMPEYDSDNATELLSSCVQEADYYGFKHYFPKYEGPALEWAEEDIRWFMQNVFHVSDAAYESARKAKISEDSKWPFYREGYFKKHATGAPTVEIKTHIDNVARDGERWIIDFRLYNGYHKEFIDDTTSRAVMCREKINDRWEWTMYSLQE